MNPRFLLRVFHCPAASLAEDPEYGFTWYPAYIEGGHELPADQDHSKKYELIRRYGFAVTKSARTTFDWSQAITFGAEAAATGTWRYHARGASLNTAKERVEFFCAIAAPTGNTVIGFTNIAKARLRTPIDDPRRFAAERITGRRTFAWCWSSVAERHEYGRAAARVIYAEAFHQRAVPADYFLNYLGCQPIAVCPPIHWVTSATDDQLHAVWLALNVEAGPHAIRKILKPSSRRRMAPRATPWQDVFNNLGDWKTR